MKDDKRIKKYVLLISAIMAAAMLAGCGKTEENSSVSTAASRSATEGQDGGSDRTVDGFEEGAVSSEATALEVRFGDDGDPFIMQLENNTTASAIARHVGTSDWRLPIYHYDDFENWEVMQYYDIPSRYEIPSNAETVTSEKAGEVYYSEPNRIILFYQDGEITGEYTKIGTIEDTEEFREAVENNPVLDGWSNKIVLINSIE